MNTPVSPEQGQIVLLRAYVKNVGSDAPATKATFKINEQILSTLDVPPIDRNAQVVLQTNWTAPTPGDYVVTVYVDPVPGERYVDDNGDKLTITVF